MTLLTNGRVSERQQSSSQDALEKSRTGIGCRPGGDSPARRTGGEPRSMWGVIMSRVKWIAVAWSAVAAMAAAVAPTHAGDWPMFHHDLSLSGYTTDDAPDTNTLAWVFTTGASVESSPNHSARGHSVGSATPAWSNWMPLICQPLPNT